MGQKKSENITFLLAHIFIIFLGVDLGGRRIIKKNFEKALIFSFYNAITHLVIDAIIWNFYKFGHLVKLLGDDFFDYLFNNFENLNNKVAEFKKNFKYWEDHWFYCTIGLDQLLHFSMLYLIYQHMTRTL
jgi:hypothetical protein